MTTALTIKILQDKKYQNLTDRMLQKPVGGQFDAIVASLPRGMAAKGRLCIKLTPCLKTRQLEEQRTPVRILRPSGALSVESRT
jgi:hypothetical protein